MPLKPFQPGQSGNPGGRKKKPLVQRALEDALTCDDSKKAREIANRLIASALHGSVGAAKLILEFTEVKPAKATSGTGDGPPLTREEVRRRLAELLSNPEVKQWISETLFDTEKPVQ